jgi:hypothetical protein
MTPSLMPPSLLLKLSLLSLLLSPTHSVAIYEPVLTPGNTIIALDDAHIRDCTPPLFDGTRFHFFATHVPVTAHSTAGYYGTIHHFYSLTSNPFGAWNTSGLALNVSTNNASAFDTFGVFTPGAIYDEDTQLWILFYGGVDRDFLRDFKYKNFTESIGLASSASPFGPWTRTASSPIAQRGPNTSFFSERVDNARPNVFVRGTTKVLSLVVKGVTSEFTALPGVWTPQSSSWDSATPYTPPISPIINASVAHNNGFENQEIYWGPDGFLHMTGMAHGCNTTPSCNPHFISDDIGLTWAYVGELSTSINEPAPIFNTNIPPTLNSPPLAFIQFWGDPDNGNRLSVRIMSLTWKPVGVAM